MLKIKSNSVTKKLDEQSILELCDYSQFKKSYNTMKISWYHRIRLDFNDFDNVNIMPKMIKVILIAFFVLLISMIFKIALLAIISTIGIFGSFLLHIVDYDNSLKNVCKKIKNYFNGDRGMEVKFYSLKQKLLSQEGKQILSLAIKNQDYGYIIKDIISNLINNDDIELLDNILKLNEVKEKLNNELEKENEKNLQSENLLHFLEHHNA